jgi:hypothetical protein
MDYWLELVDLEEEDRFYWFKDAERRDQAAVRELLNGHTVKYHESDSNAAHKAN